VPAGPLLFSVTSVSVASVSSNRLATETAFSRAIRTTLAGSMIRASTRSTRYNDRAMATYPAELERAIVLRDGARLRLRPIRPGDQDRLISFHEKLSRNTAYQRFFAAVRRLPPDWAHRLANVDYQGRLALLAEHGDGPTPELVGVARYEPTDQPDTAEIAFVIQDSWQNRGLGTLMLDALLAAAEARGIRTFRAYVLATNARMIDLLTRFTEVSERRTGSGVTELSFTRRPRPGSPGDARSP
jgi:RimJ/RimL family protein N-acetyltransferase